MIRIVDTHNRPKKRLKGIKDVNARDGIIELWQNPETEVMIPEAGVVGYDIESAVKALVDEKQIKKY